MGKKKSKSGSKAKKPTFDEDIIYLYVENPYGMGSSAIDLRDGYRSSVHANAAFQRISQWLHHAFGPQTRVRSLYCKPSSPDIIVPIEVKGRDELKIRHLLGYHHWINFVLPNSGFVKHFGDRWNQQISTVYLCTEQAEDRLIILEFQEVFLDSRRVYHEFKIPYPAPELPFEPTPRGGLKAPLPTAVRPQRTPPPQVRPPLEDETRQSEPPRVKNMDPFQQDDGGRTVLVKVEGVNLSDTKPFTRPTMAVPDDESEDNDPHHSQQQVDHKPTDAEIRAAIEAYENLPPQETPTAQAIKSDPMDESQDLKPQPTALYAHETRGSTVVQIAREMDRIKEDEITGEMERVQRMLVDGDSNRTEARERTKEEEIEKEMQRIHRITKTEPDQAEFNSSLVKQEVEPARELATDHHSIKLEYSGTGNSVVESQGQSGRHLKRPSENISGEVANQGFKRAKPEPRI